MTAIASIEDLRKKAEKRVPRMFYDYADSGSWSESTYRANEDDLQAIKFRQRVAIDVSIRDTKNADAWRNNHHAGGVGTNRADRHAIC